MKEIQRKILHTAILLFLVLATACASPVAEPVLVATEAPAPTPTPSLEREGWELIWNDEFDGTEINEANWTHEVGGDGWGNGESQYYTDNPTNSYVQDGFLVIQALEENLLGKRFTSARLSSQGKVEVQYGRIEARIKIPYGQGLWPAFWMLGNDIDKVGWPFAGEIDIMENVGFEPATVHGTIHGPGYFGGNGVGGPRNLYDGERYADNFHVYAIEWEENEIRWFVDDDQYFSVSSQGVPGEWVYDHPFYMILNVAVGGAWPGYPDDTTTFPQTMMVDYVRVYQPIE